MDVVNKLAEITVRNNLTPSIELSRALAEAYNAGATAALLAKAEDTSDADDFEDDSKSTLSPADTARIKALGIDPGKTFTIRNSVFTITAYKPSRWKYPISARTQNGTGYKFTIAQVKSHQKV